MSLIPTEPIGTVLGPWNIAPDGFRIPVTSPHVRRTLRLTAGPFRCAARADRYLERAQRDAMRPVNQAAMSPSALSLRYPETELSGYARGQFIDDLLYEHTSELHGCLDVGAHAVQTDSTEVRLAVKLNPIRGLLHRSIDLDNAALLPSLFEPDAGRFDVSLADGADRTRALQIIREHLTPRQSVLVGVVSLSEGTHLASEILLGGEA